MSETEVFDSSALGAAVADTENVRIDVDEQAVIFDDGFVAIARNPSLDRLEAFSIEATVAPVQGRNGNRQTILDGQTPPITLYLEPTGRLVGGVTTDAGPARVDSGAEVIEPGTRHHVRFDRAEDGTVTLELDGHEVARAAVPGHLHPTGERGLTLGRATTGRGNAFLGSIADLEIHAVALTTAETLHKNQVADQIRQEFVAATGIAKVVVELKPDVSHARLQPIKQIMQAAGVERLSDLDTLRITAPMTLTPGTVLVAPRKPTVPSVVWGELAGTFVAAEPVMQRALLAQHLTNRNSSAFLRALGVRAAGGREEHPAPGRAPERPAGRPPVGVAARPVGELFEVAAGGLRLVDPELVEMLALPSPSAWPVLTSQPTLMSVTTIPVGSSVIIAGTLDLTDKKLVIEPTVSTLYVIAERVICNPAATITWRRPGGSTPARADNPDLNGMGFPGQQTKEDSRDGIDGLDGEPGQPGINGARGHHAPDLEMWVKDMASMPSIDLTGESGIAGGRGQKGGDGGCGGDGAPGKWAWFFGSWCVSDPGDGGDGGNGGRGGDAGRGGDGGNGGRITIGVLEGTLAGTVTNHPFQMLNAGGAKGLGGAGGAGGSGGAGGWSGNGEVCHSAEDGHPGAPGQPGSPGALGLKAGGNGFDEFFEFTATAWDDLLTRPWITDISPTHAFPGDTVVVRGSRFSPNDRVIVGGTTLVPQINADESSSVVIPGAIAGGATTLYVRRQDATESNRVPIWIRPALDVVQGTPPLPGATMTLTGHAFAAGAAVVFKGAAIPAVVESATRLTFTVPGTGGAGSSGGSATLAVRNPDGLLSNPRTFTLPRIVEIPFDYDKHALSFGNFDDGIPDWGTYEDTFGAAEVWHEQLDPLFGHPILTALYFQFYKYFLKGQTNGGLATGFCTALASLVSDRLWLGHTDAAQLTKADNQRMLTAVHGRLLSRESILTFHDQGLQANARVEASYREIEAAFLRGCDRQTAPLLFFIPSGGILDDGYFDRIKDAHCVMPYRLVYPDGRAPALTADASSTTTDPDGVALYVWDCNKPDKQDSRLVFRRTNGEIRFDYYPTGNAMSLRSEDGFTLGQMTHGAYHLADHDLPFSGPFGLTSFIVDFLMSPADLEVTDDAGNRTGTFNGQILSEIPGSHPMYMVKGAYLLPAATALTRRIVGTAAGAYTYASILPGGATIAIEGATINPGEQDVVAISGDGTQIRITPAVTKSFDLTFGREVDGQSRAIAVLGIGSVAGAPVDITLSPELSLVRIGNGAVDRVVDVRAFAVGHGGIAPLNQQVPGIALPANHDLAIAVPDWTALNLTATAVPF